MRLPPIRYAASLLGWMAGLGVLCPVQSSAQDDAPDAQLDPIVVTGALQRGAAHTSIPPEFQVDRSVIRTLGADSLSEIVDLYAPQSDSAEDDEDPVFLLNGHRSGAR